MRRAYWAIITGSLLFSYIFYKQDEGLNYLLFTFFIIGANIWLDPRVLSDRNWSLAAFLALYSSVCVLLYGSHLAITANIISLLVLASGALNESALSWLLQGAYSVGGSCVFIVSSCIDAWKQREAGGKSKPDWLKIYVLPLALATLFFALYKSANPLFDKLTREIDIDMLRILFTLLGFLLTYGLIIHNRVEGFTEIERSLKVNIHREACKAQSGNERSAAILLFVLLNALLLFINALDLNYLYLGRGLPPDVTHKQFVHDGVGTLIFSILLGIIIIFYFLRGSLNFEDAGKPVKLLVYCWLVQNLIMVFSTAVRNKMYIDDALFTYKRIGVYYWLGLAAAGLITTAYKIYRHKTGWFIFKINSHLAFVVLVLSGGLDWDKFITEYNISRVSNYHSLDKRYLISLSETNIADVFAIRNKPGFNHDTIYHYGYYSRYGSLNSAACDYKMYAFLKEYKDDWRCYNMRKSRVKKEIDKLLPRVDSLNFSGYFIRTLEPVRKCSRLRQLILTYQDTAIYNEVKWFPLLKALSLSNVQSNDLRHFTKLKRIDTLKIYHTQDTVIEKLRKMLPGKTVLQMTPKTPQS